MDDISVNDDDDEKQYKPKVSKVLEVKIPLRLGVEISHENSPLRRSVTQNEYELKRKVRFTNHDEIIMQPADSDPIFKVYDDEEFVSEGRVVSPPVDML